LPYDEDLCEQICRVVDEKLGALKPAR